MAIGADRENAISDRSRSVFPYPRLEAAKQVERRAGLSAISKITEAIELAIVLGRQRVRSSASFGNEPDSTQLLHHTRGDIFYSRGERCHVRAHRATEV